MDNKEIKLQLIKEGDFLGTKCDFYKDEDNNNIYMTREQIGKALQYANPRDGIFRIHERNKDRLDRFSTVVKLSTVEGSRSVSRDRVLYIERGIYDICRFSRQPVADEFYDWVYDQIQLIRRNAGTVIEGREMEFLDNYFPSLQEETKLMMVKDLQNTVKEKQREIDELTPKAEDWSAFMDSKGNMTISKVAKALDIEGIGRNKLFDILRNKEVLRSNNEPYQRYINDGYFKVIAVAKNGRKFAQTLVTGKGMSWINKKMKEWGYA